MGYPVGYSRTGAYQLSRQLCFRPPCQAQPYPAQRTWALPRPHLRRDFSGLTLPHLRQGWAHPCRPAAALGQAARGRRGQRGAQRSGGVGQALGLPALRRSLLADGLVDGLLLRRRAGRTRSAPRAAQRRSDAAGDPQPCRGDRIATCAWATGSTIAARVRATAARQRSGLWPAGLQQHRERVSDGADNSRLGRSPAWPLPLGRSPAWPLSRLAALPIGALPLGRSPTWPHSAGAGLLPRPAAAQHVLLLGPLQCLRVLRVRIGRPQDRLPASPGTLARCAADTGSHCQPPIRCRGGGSPAPGQMGEPISAQVLAIARQRERDCLCTRCGAALCRCRLPHRRRGSAHPCHIGTGTDRAVHTSSGLG